MFEAILSRYGIDTSDCSVKPFGNGLINHTWKIVSGGKEWLLQKINKSIFRRPEDIMDNCRLLSHYFSAQHPNYLFIAPLIHSGYQNYVKDEDGNYYRLFPFVKNSFTCDAVSRPILAFEAALQFGRFTRLLSGFPADQLKITLPDFHNLSLRQQQFETALREGNKKRIGHSAAIIEFLNSQQEIVGIYDGIIKNSSVPLRVVHHDAKISNVLFDLGTDQGTCVIDLDTVMPGYYFSDVGDMLRTYLSPAGEEEPDFSRIEIREEYFLKILQGYLGEMRDVLSDEEKKYFVYAGKFAIYLQAIRFLTDYLNDDKYYSIQYPGQNFLRAGNQSVLLKRYLDKEQKLHSLLNNNNH